MGQRANLVIVEPPGYRLFYSHWCANTLDRDLFWGPDHAEAFIRLQRPVADDDWLDTVWAEGGAVLDKPNRTLLLFGGEDVNYSVPLRRLYLKLLQAVWNDWKILWAHEGIVDIAEYVGVPRAKVIATAQDDRGFGDLKPPQEREWIDSVGSFRTDDGLKLYPLPGDADDYLQAGPELCNSCDSHPSYPTLVLAEWSREFPKSGFHIDSTERTVDLWTSSPCPGVLAELRPRWPDWTVTWHKDHFESQRELTGGALTFNEPPFAELATSLETSLMYESKPVDVLDIAKHLNVPDPEQIQINPYALRDDRLPLGQRERQAILDSAFFQVRANAATERREDRA